MKKQPNIRPKTNETNAAKYAALALLLAISASARAAEYQWNTQSSDQPWNNTANWLADGEEATTLPGPGDTIGDPINFITTPVHGSKVHLTGNQEVSAFLVNTAGGWGIIAGDSPGSLVIDGDATRTGVGSFYFRNSVTTLTNGSPTDPGIATASTFDLLIKGSWLGGAVLLGNAAGQLHSATIQGGFTVDNTVEVNSPNANFNGGITFTANNTLFVHSEAGTAGGFNTAYLASSGGGTGQIIGARLLNSTATVTINGGTGSWNYAGTLVDLAGGTAGAGSTLAIVKTGSNTQTFSRAAGNTYSRGTTISGGTLLVTNTSGSGLGVGSVDVQSGGAIGGTGIIALGTDKTVTIHNGGTITPGDGLGALRFNGLNTSGPALTLEAGSKIVFDLGAANASDQIQFLNYSGAADLVRGGTVLDFTTAQAGVFTLFAFYSDNGTTLTPAGFDELASNFQLGSGLDGFQATWDYSTPGQIKLNVSAVPEPTTLALLVGVGLGFLLLRRSRQRGV